MRELPTALGEMLAELPAGAFFHQAFETAPIGMLLVDLEGRIQYVNFACCEMFGYTADELRGRDFLSLIHADDREASRELLPALRGGRENVRFENRAMGKGGDLLWVRVSASLLRGADGAPRSIVATVEDVTPQRVMEQARLELHREREALLDSAAEGIYGADLDGVCTFVNRSAAEMLGYTPEEMLDRNMHELVHAKYPDGRSFPAAECRIVQAFSQPRDPNFHLRNYEQILWHKDGSPVAVEHSAEAVMVDGQLRGTVVTLRDVSDRNARRAERKALLEQEQVMRQRAESLNEALKKKEAALRESLAEQMQLMEAIPQMVWVTGPAGEPEYVNERWRAFTGNNSAGERAWAWLDLIHPEDREPTQEQFEQALQSGLPYEVEHRMRASDGGYRWMLARAQPLVDASGKISRWFGTSTDVHDRKTADDLLRRTEKLAAAGRLAATVAHEINNPLEAVGNLIYLAAHEQGLSTAASRYLQTASDELHRVGRIVSQTLGFYRESSTAEKVDLSNLVIDVIALYQRKLDARQIRVTRSFEHGAIVVGIPGELRQVIANLLSNAMDAMEPYGVLGIEVRTQQAEVRLSVSDTGKGIAKPILEHIFDQFFTTKKNHGTGLGLWVSRGIAEKHQGRLDVSSSQREEDHGTAFVLTLPRHQLAS